MKISKYIVITTLSGVGILLSGCSTIVNAHLQKQKMMTSYISGNHAEAQKELNDYLDSRIGGNDEIMWRLEAGSFFWLTGQDEKSIDHLTHAEKKIENFDQRAIINLRQAGSEAAVLLTNPNAIPYRGLCRDRIMLPVYKAFAYLGKGDEEGFRVELFRLRENQVKVQETYRKFFEAEDKAVNRAKQKNAEAARNANQDKFLNNSRNLSTKNAIEQAKQVSHRGYGNFMNPFSIFLSAYGYIRENDFENAHVDFERLYKALPNNPIVKKYYVTILKKTNRTIPAELAEIIPFEDSCFNQNSVLVVFANGRSAALRQIALYIPIFLPRYATVATTAWPVCEYYRAPYTHLHITSGSSVFQTLSIADMDGIFSQEYTKRLPLMITRIALSTAAKEIGSYIATEAARRADPLAGLFVAIGTSVYKSVVNTADTRTWEILPKEFQIAHIPMPADRKITIAPDGHSPRTIQIPETAKSAIIYVNAPSTAPNAFSCRVLQHKTK